ncbi:MAG: hypothetical protein IH941_07120 [Acidobacteria bacterium]|nr:hypothetical protein [Acidobacteriota bacterium]
MRSVMNFLFSYKRPPATPGAREDAAASLSRLTIEVGDSEGEVFSGGAFGAKGAAMAVGRRC